MWYFAVYQWLVFAYLGIVKCSLLVMFYRMVVQGSAVSQLFPGPRCGAVLISNESVLFAIVW